ncbi:MAG: substrate-binding domain-containing protein [Pseudomonadota bacterium]
MALLQWPQENAHDPDPRIRFFSAPESNLVLDFHGDPAHSGLTVFSDGNHHMALEAAIREFATINPKVGDVFYTTTPPAPLVAAAKGHGLMVGNLHLNVQPDIFIGPENIISNLATDGLVSRHAPFVQSRGNVLLVRKHNPKNIHSVSDLLSDSVRLTCSNPQTEKASFEVYREAAINMANQADAATEDLVEKLSGSSESTVHSQVIHHREVPQIIADDKADAAIIYYHLALRYTRIFPDIFDLVDVQDNLANNRPEAGPITQYHIGIVNQKSSWSEAFYEFMQHSVATEIYEYHGLSALH